MTGGRALYGVPWGMRQREGGARGRAAVPAPDDPSALGAPWPFRAAGAVPAAPAIDHGGALYVPTAAGVLHRVEATGGGVPILDAAPLWTTPALAVDPVPQGGGEGHPPPPQVAAVYAADAAGVLHCVRPDGTELWSLNPGSARSLRSAPVAHRPATGGSLSWIWLGDEDGRLFGIAESAPDAARVEWEYTVVPGAPVRTSPVLSADGFTVRLGGSDGRLHVLDAQTGQAPYAPVQLSSSGLFTPAQDTHVTYVTGRDGFLHAVERGGQLLWSLRLGADLFAGPAVGPDGTVLAVADGRLHAVSPQGTVLWREPLPERFSTAPVVDSGGVCVLASDGGTVVGVRTDPGVTGATRVLWQVRPGSSALTGVALDGHGRIFTGDRSGLLHALDDAPAFQVFVQGALQTAGGQDVYALREVYGTPDPARTLRVTDAAAREEGEPATSLDRSVIAYASRPPGESFTASPRGGYPAPLAAGVEPAFTPVDEVTGDARAPHGARWATVTAEPPGSGRRLLFTDLDAGTRRTFTQWAAGLGVPAPLLGGLEPADTEQSHAAFAPDGRHVAWRHWDPATTTSSVHLLRLGPSGWDVTAIGPSVPYDPEAHADGPDEPCFSPDSRWLAVREGLSVAMYDVRGVLPAVFTSPGKGRVPRHPAWSPDGTELAVGLRDGAAVDVWVASGPGFTRYDRLTSGREGDEPVYHFFRMPPPRVDRLDPDRQVPDAQVRILGRGFDILRPENNIVEFTHTLRGTPLRAPVARAEVDPVTGMGVLTVRVPRLAGHGPVTVRTRHGVSTGPDLHVLPDPLRLEQPRTVPGARIRVFGRGFDLTPATRHAVLFAAEGGGRLAAPVERGEVAGDEEFLVVTVPSGVARNAEVRVANAYGEGVCPRPLGLLSPSVEFVRPVDERKNGGGLLSYAGQGAQGVDVRLRGTGFPYDPYFGHGTAGAHITAEPAPGEPPAAAAPLHYAEFRQTGPDTAELVPAEFPFPALPAGHPGGGLRILATDQNLPAARAETAFRVPQTDIPVVFVPGTSGTSLDLAPGTATPFTAGVPADVHAFPWLSKTALPFPLDPLGPLVHSGETFSCDPASPAPGRPADPRGPRIWGGTEMAKAILDGTATLNSGNHYLDLCAFNATGTAVHPQVVPGTVLQDALVVPPLLSGTGGWGFKPVYKPMVDFLRKANTATGWPGRPLCLGTSPATSPCVDENGAPASGRNAVYLFNLDWRQDLATEAGRLAAFIDAIRSRPDVAGRKVAIVTHSYGGPVARAYYLDPANSAATKVDQVITLGGGFLGVIEPLDILEEGSTWGQGFALGPVGFGIQPWETRNLAQNWPTAYFQLPNSEDWFSDHGAVMDGRMVNRAYVRDYRWPGGAGEIPSHAASTAWIRARHNPVLTDAHTAFFAPPGGPASTLGDFTGGTGPVFHHRIIGQGRPDTVVAVAVRLLPSWVALHKFFFDPVAWAAEMVPTEHWEAVHGDGDSTVSYHGALGLTLPQDDRVYVLNGAEHSSLPNLPEFIGTSTTPGLLQLLLEGKVGSSADAPAPFLSQNDVTERPALAAVAEEADRWVLEFRGTASFDVTDDRARHLGPYPRLPQAIEESIPGATLRPGPLGGSAFLPEGHYEVRLTARESGALRLHVRRFLSARPLDTLLFRAIALEQDECAVLRLEPATGADGSAWIEVLADDGTLRDRVPAEFLTPAQAADTAPPRTVASIVDGAVELTADDGPAGSGVRHSLLSLDGLRHEPYDKPVPLPDDACLVMAYSEDAAGNLEYPGWTLGALGLGTGGLTFRPDKGDLAALVGVRNLDPLGVSAPIGWAATTDAKWLALSPSAGSTPGTLRIAVLPDQLPDNQGDFKTEVRITVTDPDAVFRTRTLPVRIVALPGPSHSTTD